MKTALLAVQAFEEELNAYAQLVDKAYGKSGGTTKIYFVPDVDDQKMIKEFGWNESSSFKMPGSFIEKSYGLLGHNCHTYARDMVKKFRKPNSPGSDSSVSYGLGSWQTPNTSFVGIYNSGN